ncbi:MAG: GNAT family N-acetyltransferase [bacterium]
MTIRAVRPDDKTRISAAFRNLQPESLYTRFFLHRTNELTGEELREVTEVDFDNIVALVVTVATGGGEETIIGAGRYARCASPGAEIAFIVEEDYQGQGIASRIFGHLVRIAREKGVSRFEAEVFAGNRAMLAVFERSGLALRKSLEEGVVHVSISLSAPA